MRDQYLVGAALVVALGLTLGGCFLDTVADCANLCDRYQECFDSEVDVGDCTARCQSRVDDGDGDLADRCDSCLDDHPGSSTTACLEAAAACYSPCNTLLAP